jgi:hypothetical protein
MLKVCAGQYKLDLLILICLRTRTRKPDQSSFEIAILLNVDRIKIEAGGGEWTLNRAVAREGRSE